MSNNTRKDVNRMENLHDAPCKGAVGIHGVAGSMVKPTKSARVRNHSTTRPTTPLWQNTVHIYSVYIAIVEG